MYLLYIDHSGEVANPQDEYFVMAGAAIFERQLYFLKKELDRIQRDSFPDSDDDIEFHASVMRNHKKAPWDRMQREDIEKIMNEVYRVIANSHNPGLCLFAQSIEKSCVIPNYKVQMTVALQKKKEAEQNLKDARGDEKQEAIKQLKEAEMACQEIINPIIARGFEGLCIQFEFFLRRFHDASQRDHDQRGLLIFDHASYEKELELLMNEFNLYGTRAGELYNIVEAPFCIDSNSTRMLQIADFVSYALFRRYESKDTQYFDIIDQRFDEVGGVMHGLSHITSNPKCKCPACLSRTIVNERT